jgi:hypothetical protein
VIAINPANPEDRDFKILAGPGPETFAAEPDGVWHSDFRAPAIIKSDFQGKLVEWGDQVFERGVAGLAWDGERLWALDGVNHRICVIQRSDTERPAAAAEGP